MEGGVWTQTNTVDYSVVCQYTDVCMVYSRNGIYKGCSESNAPIYFYGNYNRYKEHNNTT